MLVQVPDIFWMLEEGEFLNMEEIVFKIGTFNGIKANIKGYPVGPGDNVFKFF